MELISTQTNSKSIIQVNITHLLATSKYFRFLYISLILLSHINYIV